MTVTISGSTGIANPLGSATAPAETNTTNANTGAYFPTGTTYAITTAGTNALYIDASQNVGIGTTSPGARLQVTDGNFNQLYLLSSTTVSGIRFGNTVYTNGYIYYDNGANLIFHTNGAERGRFDSSGNLLVGATDAGTTTGVGIKLLPSTTTPNTSMVYNTSSGTAYGWMMYNTNATYNGYRFFVGTDGGIRNYSANNVNLSDERSKTDIQLAGSYLEKICAIPVKTFKFKDQGEDQETTLGVIAQDVEKIAPELVDASGFGETPSDGVPLKAIYQTDLQYALMKALQEAVAKIDALETEVTALKAKVGA